MTRRSIARAATLLALTVTFLFTSSAPAQSGTYRGWFSFKKNYSDQTNSTLAWHYNDGVTPTIYKATVGRSGSGVTKNDCEIGKGWLPNGSYGQLRHEHDKDDLIKGRVWWIQDKPCSSALATRTELFIHSEETRWAKQEGCIPGGDGPYCWEGAWDYKSAGCVKISHPNYGFPSTISTAHNRYHDSGAGGYPDGVAALPEILLVE